MIVFLLDIKILAVIAYPDALAGDIVHLIADAAEPCGESGYRAEVKYEISRADLSAKHHGYQHGICRAVAYQRQKRVDATARQSARTDLLRPFKALALKASEHSYQPPEHAVYTDVLRVVEFFGKALQILYLTVGIYPLVLVPLDIIPLPTADEICTERGQKQQPQYKRGDARYDRAVCEYSERADEKIEQRHPYKFRRALPGAGVVIRVLKLHYHLRVVGIRVVGAHIFLS